MPDLSTTEDLLDQVNKRFHQGEKEKEFEATESTTEANPLWDDEFEKKTLAKIDGRLIIILGLLAAVCLIDRGNLASARVVGMGKALELDVGDRYSILTSVFAIPYILCELPMMILMRKIGARLLLTIVVVGWGGATMIMGSVNDWRQLLALRVILGFFESAFMPGCTYLVGCWYTRYETQQRMAWFLFTSLVLTGLSNIISYGISKLDGTHHIAGWRWIFIVWGAVTLGLGIIGALVIVDFPDKNKFLTAEETRFVRERIERDRADCDPDEITLAKVIKHLLDFKLWIFGLCFCFNATVFYVFNFFLPVILKAGGFSIELALCLSAPPYLWAACYNVAIGYVADKIHRRAVFVYLHSLMIIIGLVIVAWGGKIGIRYMGTFLALAGTHTNITTILSWGQNNVRLQSKRQVAIAITLCLGGAGGVIASFIFRQQDAPAYLPGLITTIGCQVAIILMTFGLTLVYKRANKRADHDGTEAEGDRNFRYTL